VKQRINRWKIPCLERRVAMKSALVIGLAGIALLLMLYILVMPDAFA
jgi:hypothetical protein